MSSEIDRILQAAKPAALFGTAGGEELEELVRKLRIAVHPDRFPDDPAKQQDALRATERLADLYDQHTAAKKIVVQSGKRSYAVAEKLGDGMLSVVYRTTCDHVLKVATTPGCRDLMLREWQQVSRLREKAGDSIFAKYLPTPVETFDVAQERSRYPVNVFTYDPEAYTLREIRGHFRKGLDPRHVAWIFNRMLDVLGFVQTTRRIHGAMLPENILVRPKDHGLILIDWVAASKTKVRAIDEKRRAWYPQEILDGAQPLAPQTDLYMAAKTVVYLLGGNPLTNEIPDHVPVGMERVLRACLLTSMGMRPADVWRLQDSYKQTLEQIYGSPRFVKLNYPEV